jgi:hypothetical protein
VNDLLRDAKEMAELLRSGGEHDEADRLEREIAEVELSVAFAREFGERASPELTLVTSTPSSSRFGRHRRMITAGVAAAVAAVLGFGLEVGLSGGAPRPSVVSTAAYRYYQSVMDRVGLQAMTGPSGYSWMMGGAGAPRWLAGSMLPRYLMGMSSDPGVVMGALFANAPGPRVSSAEAAKLASTAPGGARIDRAANRIAFSTSSVRLTVVAAAGANNTFEIAGLTDPSIVVPLGAHVSITLVNADSDAAHGFVITSPRASTWREPMMTSSVALPGAAVWFLPDSTAAGAHLATVRFTARRAGRYEYCCPVPGMSRHGMAGVFNVEGV